MNNKQTIEVPREWIEGLIQASQFEILITPSSIVGAEPVAKLNYLLGYIKSAESFLNHERSN